MGTTFFAQTLFSDPVELHEKANIAPETYLHQENSQKLHSATDIVLISKLTKLKKSAEFLQLCGLPCLLTRNQPSKSLINYH
jgi:hypothetical protein